MPKKILKGLDMFHYALVNTNTTASVSYQTPVPMNGAITVAVNPNSEVEILDTDDGQYDSEENSGPIDMDVGIADISQEDYAAWMGHTITGGVMSEINTDQPVELAFGFRAKRTNGGHSYYWFLVGKFSKPSMSHQTKGTFQTPTLSGKFYDRMYDGKRKYSTRTDATDYTAAIGAAWFSSVYGTTADSTAPTYSSSIPSASGTSATQTTNITITFSEAILSSTVTAANFTLLQTSSSETVPIASFAISTGGETVTLTQSLFTASTTYNVIMGTGIRDTAGNGMSGSATFKFTTTA
ncbi:MAG: Ig-like domain-containing protein [Eubacteriales bacterium]|nr:Ig-like domain-containing protein [Eubacteriales bacterium]